MIRLAKITCRVEIKRDWSCGKSTSKTKLLPWTKPQSAWKISIKVGSRPCRSKAAMTSDRVVSGLMLPLWEEVLWPFLDAWDSVRLRTTSSQWNVPGRYGRYGELFFFLLKKEPMVIREFGPSIPVEAVKACALVGLHMMAEEDPWRWDRGSSVSSNDSCEDNALHVIGLHGPGDKISLFLQDWEVAKVALSCHTALDVLCQELHEVERRRGWFGF